MANAAKTIVSKSIIACISASIDLMAYFTLENASSIGLYRVYSNRTHNFKSGLRTIRVRTIPGSEFSSVN